MKLHYPSKSIQLIRCTLVLVLSTCLSSFAQTTNETEILPRGMTSTEMELLDSYKQHLLSQSMKNPTAQKLSSPVRAMAEWEEIDYLCITWTQNLGFASILADIAENAALEAKVINICADSIDVKDYLSNNGVSLNNQVFLETPNNSIWMRDYGPWNIYTNDVDSLYIVDWIYNRPRPRDDTIPRVLARYLDLPISRLDNAPDDLVHTGGNFMLDGFGQGFSSELVLDENWFGNFNITNKTEAQIDSLVNDYMAVSEFVKMTVLPYDGINHIDMHMKLLNETTLLVGEYPEGVADGPQIEANIAYIQDNFLTVFGTPYNIIRIPQPPDQFGRYPDNNGYYRTYTNSVFVNGSLLIPTYEEEYDTTALRIYQEALPGYKLVGINSNDIIPLSGAIHCITKEVGSQNPLLISHNPLPKFVPNTQDYVVNARIQHRTGILFADVYYATDTIDGGDFQTVSMTLSDADNHIWTANIPAQTSGDEVFYYISAFAGDGKFQSRPIVAPAGTYSTKVVEEVVGVEDVLPTTSTFELGDIYPNPSQGLTVIPITSPATGKVVITLHNILGQSSYLAHAGILKEGEQNIFINTLGLGSGIYTVEILFEGEKQVQQLVIGR